MKSKRLVMIGCLMFALSAILVPFSGGYWTIAGKVILASAFSLVIGTVLVVAYARSNRRTNTRPRRTVLLACGLIAAYLGFGLFRHMMTVTVHLLTDVDNTCIISCDDVTVIITDRRGMADQSGRAHAASYWVQGDFSLGAEEAVEIKSGAIGEIDAHIHNNEIRYRKHRSIEVNKTTIAITDRPRLFTQGSLVVRVVDGTIESQE